MTPSPPDCYCSWGSPVDVSCLGEDSVCLAVVDYVSLYCLVLRIFAMVFLGLGFIFIYFFANHPMEFFSVQSPIRFFIPGKVSVVCFLSLTSPLSSTTST